MGDKQLFRDYTEESYTIIPEWVEDTNIDEFKNYTEGKMDVSISSVNGGYVKITGKSDLIDLEEHR